MFSINSLCESLANQSLAKPSKDFSDFTKIYCSSTEHFSGVMKWLTGLGKQCLAVVFTGLALRPGQAGFSLLYREPLMRRFTKEESGPYGSFMKS